MSKKAAGRPRGEHMEKYTQACTCGCGSITKPGSKYILGHNRLGVKKIGPDPKPCECGCGELAKSGNRYCHYHHMRGRKLSIEHIAKILKTRIRNGFIQPKKKKSPAKCACGCNLMAKSGNRYILGHNRLRNRNKINHTENQLLELVEPLGFRFVGDRRFWVGKYNPDFIHDEKKIIIELFGRYWHANDKRSKVRKRLETFMSNGYKWLIIWDDDLRNNIEEQIERVKKKLWVAR